jgi:ribosomal protein L29
MEMHEIKEKESGELAKMVQDMQDELRDLKFQAANLKLKNVRRVRSLKRSIARIQTELSNRANA